MQPHVLTEHCTRDWVRLAGSDGDAAAHVGVPIYCMTSSLVLLSVCNANIGQNLPGIGEMALTQMRGENK